MVLPERCRRPIICSFRIEFEQGSSFDILETHAKYGPQAEGGTLSTTLAQSSQTDHWGNSDLLVKA